MLCSMGSPGALVTCEAAALTALPCGDVQRGNFKGSETKQNQLQATTTLRSRSACLDALLDFNANTATSGTINIAAGCTTMPHEHTAIKTRPTLQHTSIGAMILAVHSSASEAPKQIWMLRLQTNGQVHFAPVRKVLKPWQLLAHK